MTAVFSMQCLCSRSAFGWLSGTRSAAAERESITEGEGSPGPQQQGCDGGHCVLDGADSAVAAPQVGTIFGVWPGDKLKGITGRDQAAAGMGVFGPRTCFVIALKDAPGCHEFLLQVPRAVQGLGFRTLGRLPTAFGVILTDREKTATSSCCRCLVQSGHGVSNPRQVAHRVQGDSDGSREESRSGIGGRPEA